VKGVIAPTGYITDHSHGDSYLPNSDCGWMVQSSVPGPMTVLFIHLSVQLGYDVVSVYDINYSGSVLGQYSGYFLPNPVVTSSNSFFVHFTTNAVVDMNGWRAYYASNSLCLNSCDNRGYCVNGTCICYAGYGGADCSIAAPYTPITIGELTYASVPIFSWQYFSFSTNNQVYQLQVQFHKTSNHGHPEFYIQSNNFPTFASYYSANVYWNPDNNIRIVGPTPATYFVGVYGREAADFSLIVTLTCQTDSSVVNGTCLCNDRCMTGFNCGEPLCGDRACNEGVCHGGEGSSDSGTHPKGSNKGAIIAAVCVVGGLAALAGGYVGFKYYRKKRQESSGTTEMKSTGKKGFKQFEDEDA